MIVMGIDEVGRGPWAGPVVAAAVILRDTIPGLRDSKLLTAKRRQQLADEILAYSYVGVGWVQAEEIDQLGLTAAVGLAMRRAVEQLNHTADKIIIDGNYNFLPDMPEAETLIKADQTVPAVSAASIVAKQARDSFMAKLGQQYPQYGFEKHVGYGTTQHAAALRQHGPLQGVHRFSFKPVYSSKSWLPQTPGKKQNWPLPTIWKCAAMLFWSVTIGAPDVKST